MITRKICVHHLSPLLILAAAWVAPLTPTHAQEASDTPAVVLQSAAVTTLRMEESFVVERRFSGRFSATAVSDLGFDLSGEVTELLVEEGDAVSEGDILARLDQRSLDAQRSELVAARDEALARQSLAQADFDRLEPLVPNTASVQRLDAARAELDAARAAVARLDASLAQIEVNVSDSVLRAPFAGDVVTQYVDRGTVVSPGQAIFRLNAGGAIQAEIGIPSRFRSQIREGEPYRLTAGSLTGVGVPNRIINAIDLRTQTLTVIFDIIEDPGFIPSDLVRVTLTDTVRADGAWVDAGALHQSFQGLWAVYTVVDAPEADTAVVVRNDVEIIHIEEERAFVRGAFEDGARIITASPFRFVPGQTVRPVLQDERVASVRP